MTVWRRRVSTKWAVARRRKWPASLLRRVQDGSARSNRNSRMIRRGVLTLGRLSYSNSDPLVWANQRGDLVTVGDRCSISYRVAIVFPGDHDLSASSPHPSFYDVAGRTPLRVAIGDDVLIGFGAIILAPCTVGHGAVIGAGAVVTRDVAGGEVVAGVPARTIRYRSK